MNEDNRVKPNYNNPEYDSKDSKFENQYGDTSYAPNQYNNRGYTDSFYYENEDSGAGSFLFGAIVGGVIGAAAALFLAPKTGKEMREDLSTQTGNLKDKSIEISTVAKDKAVEYSAVAKDKATEFGTVAKDKATEYSAVAKDKTTEFTASAKEKTGIVTKSIQKQSGQLVDKVKSMTSKKAAPLDDGTVAFEGEELIEFVEKLSEDVTEQAEEVTTSVSEAIKDAVVKETQTTK